MVKPGVVEQAIRERLTASRAVERDGDVAAAWRLVEDAHVLAQPWATPHVRVHWRMLGLGWRCREPREVLGQIGRLVVAGPASIFGRFPAGNSGRADVSAFAPAPIRDDLAKILEQADCAEAEDTGVLKPTGVRRLYDRLAPFYDLASKPYGWFGVGKLVDQTIAELRLAPGDTVVDLGTGTGRNLLVLAEIVGPTGRVIGVDLSPRMLRRAQHKIDRRDLLSVELIEADMATVEIPEDTAAVLATYAIEMLPNYDEVIELLSAQMPSGRIAVNGLRHPERWPEWVIKVATAINRPFGVSEDYRSHRPWEAIEAHTVETVYQEAVGGAVYLAAGTTTENET